MQISATGYINPLQAVFNFLNECVGLASTAWWSSSSATFQKCFFFINPLCSRFLHTLFFFWQFWWKAELAVISNVALHTCYVVWVTTDGTQMICRPACIFVVVVVWLLFKKLQIKLKQTSNKLKPHTYCLLKILYKNIQTIKIWNTQRWKTKSCYHCLIRRDEDRSLAVEIHTGLQCFKNVKIM